jgi:Na+-translocating ferredoxin:NAD+ oxidoreductase subunit B
MIMLLNASVQWNKVGLVLGLIAGLAVVLTVAILIVTKVCKIKEDETLLKVIENLAGANCGGCGYSGCEGFAKGLCSGKACLNDCKSTSIENKKIIAELTGVEFVAESPTVAVVRCNGGDAAVNKFCYFGNNDCHMEMLYHKGSKVCTTACLGHGSCEKVCQQNAITVVNHVAHVNPALCTSCGSCINTCPKLCIERIPNTAPVYVACNTKCRGKETIAQCANGCIACGLCAKFCPQKAITMVDNLPVIDYTKCTGCKTCVLKCPKKVIKEHTM